MAARPMNANAKAHLLITEVILKEALLKNKGPAAKYKAFEIVDFCNRDDHYPCFVTGVKVTFIHRGQQKNIAYIAKLNHCNEQESHESLSSIIFKKEGNFYLKLISNLNKVMESLGFSPLKFAPCYFVSFEPRKQVILLGDKREDSFIKANRFLGLDDEHVILVVKELARLHASSATLEDNLGPEKFHEKYDFLADFFACIKDENMASILKKMCVKYAKISAKIADRIAGYEKVSAWLRKKAPDSFEMMETVTSECDPKFRVINHGDCWIDNLLFRYEDEKVTDVCLLDLQGNRHASLALDLNYFFFTSVNGNTRKKGLESYLTTYYNFFKEVFDAAQKPMKFTREELYAEYRKKNLFGLLMAMMVVSIMVMESTDAPDMQNLGGKITRKKMKGTHEEILDLVDTSPVLRSRMLDMFDEMVEHGTIKLD